MTVNQYLIISSGAGCFATPYRPGISPLPEGAGIPDTFKDGVVSSGRSFAKCVNLANWPRTRVPLHFQNTTRFRELLRGGIESFVESLFIAQGRGFLELPAVSSDDIGTDSREGCRYPERDRLYRRVDNSAENMRDCDDVIYSLPTTTTFFVQSTKLCAYLSCVCLDCLRKMEGGGTGRRTHAGLLIWQRASGDYCLSLCD